MQNQAKDLFILQTDLIDNKVEISVITAVSQVVDQIKDLRMEMHHEMGAIRQEMHREIGTLRQEMHSIKHEVIERLTAVETTLNMRNQIHKELRNRFLDHTFRAGWALGLMAVSVVISSLVVLLHTT